MSSISIETELLDSGILVASDSREIVWDGGIGSQSISFCLGGFSEEFDVSVELTAKMRSDGAAGGFVRVQETGNDLALWSYFCRPSQTESMGVRLAGGVWFRLSVSNRKDKAQCSRVGFQPT